MLVVWDRVEPVSAGTSAR